MTTSKSRPGTADSDVSEIPLDNYEFPVIADRVVSTQPPSANQHLSVKNATIQSETNEAIGKINSKMALTERLNKKDKNPEIKKLKQDREDIQSKIEVESIKDIYETSNSEKNQKNTKDHDNQKQKLQERLKVK